MIMECRSCHHLAENTELIRRPSGVSECLRCGGIRFLIRPFLRRGPDGRIILLVEDPERGGDPASRPAIGGTVARRGRRLTLNLSLEGSPLP